MPAEVIVGARSEHTRLWDSEQGLLGPIEGRVSYVESLGRETLIGVGAGNGAQFVVEAEGHVHVEPQETIRFASAAGGSTSSIRATSVPSAASSARRVRVK